MPVNGRVMAVGVFPISPGPTNRFVEFYNPTNNTWTLGPNPRALRNRPEALILPDGRVLAFGGQYSGTTSSPVPLANAGTIANCTKVADLYDPALNSWRAVADLNRFIHYHNVTLLVPDGRVIATGGAGLTSSRSFAGDDSSIEAFEPPYLFRGVRPRIDMLSTTDLVIGSTFTVQVSLTERITRIVLVSARAATHWNDGGPQRFLDLNFEQTGPDIVAAVPSSALQAVPGFYILFALVDDIPSIGRMVRVTQRALAPLDVPNVTIVPEDPTSSEAGGDSGSFRVVRTGQTNAPLTVNFVTKGSAVAGVDYNTPSNFVVIAAGASLGTITLTPRNDAASEGSETAEVRLVPGASYRIGPEGAASVTIFDDDPAPLALSLQLARQSDGFSRVTIEGPATAVSKLQVSEDLRIWSSFTSVLTSTNGQTRLWETFTNSHLFFRAFSEP
jgi:hypothetical protein